MFSHDLISFDLDGTLVDTAAEIAEAANRTLESHGVVRRPVAEITLLIGGGMRELMCKLWLRCVLEQPSEAVLASANAHYASIVGSSAQPYRGCHEALAELKRAGLHLACVTNKELRHARRVLDANRLDGYFDLVIGGDSLVEKKPHPSVLRHVARTLGVALARTAHLGDSAIDIAAARQAGVAAWAVSYGYTAGLPIAECGPDRLFDELLEVSGHVLGSRQ